CHWHTESSSLVGDKCQPSLNVSQKQKLRRIPPRYIHAKDTHTTTPLARIEVARRALGKTLRADRDHIDRRRRLARLQRSFTCILARAGSPKVLAAVLECGF